MEFPLVINSWDKTELEELTKVLKSGWLTAGGRVTQFEHEFAELFHSPYAVMCNSGSSANLLAIAALAYKKDHPLKRGDEVIVPSVAWATTYAPLQQYGLKLKVLDVDPTTLNIRPQDLQRALTPQTKMLVGVSILGNPCCLNEMKTFCQENHLYFMEDNCESMGAQLNGKFTGTFGDLGTFSTFFTHHISTIEGGVVLTPHKELYELMLSLRSHGWSRTPGSDKPNEIYEFLYPGYNLRPTELAAAAGSLQLKKFPQFIEQRRANASYFQEVFAEDSKVQIQKESGKSSWFAFAFYLKPDIKMSRDQVMALFKQNGIECRMVTGGNFTRHPSAKFYDYQCIGSLDGANLIHDRGLFVGNSHIDLTAQIDLLKQIIQEKVQ